MGCELAGSGVSCVGPCGGNILIHPEQVPRLPTLLCGLQSRRIRGLALSLPIHARAGREGTPVGASTAWASIANISRH